MSHSVPHSGNYSCRSTQRERCPPSAFALILPAVVLCILPCVDASPLHDLDQHLSTRPQHPDPRYVDSASRYLVMGQLDRYNDVPLLADLVGKLSQYDDSYDLLTAIAVTTEAFAPDYPDLGDYKTLAMVFEALTRRRIHAPNLYKGLARRILYSMDWTDALDAQAVANTAWALAKLWIDQRETFDQLESIGEMDIAKMVWAMVTLWTYPNTPMALGRHALSIASTFTPQDADTALRAFGRLMILDQIPGLRTALNERATAASAASETRPTGAAPASKRVWGSRRGPTGTLASAALEASTPVPFEDDSTQCPICLDNYANPDGVTTLICGHTFHARCIIPDVMMRNCCPMCQGVVFE
ncbi:unnamed protein product (mitochondrion) [Plasmodiophora brassicae]|uniref:RING-type domain-containing protein n=1 Tax=Plasmodiophora brassicae TaxID=37360 RepID=A0A3P3YGT8_PLABS|nr:unnamed protein product [Plasmodiophora brassicae]